MLGLKLIYVLAKQGAWPWRLNPSFRSLQTPLLVNKDFNKDRARLICSNLASDWLAAQPPANQKPDSKYLLTNMDSNMEISS